MQLSLPGVGYGVLESPVDSGNVYKHPFKRARTTGTYLAAATIGTDDDRILIRAAVDRVHAGRCAHCRQPVSLPRDWTPNCSCGWRPACTAITSTSTSSFTARWTKAADAIYADARTLGTTLQVRERHVAGRPGCVRRILEALAGRAADRPAGSRASRSGRVGVPALATAGAGRAVQSVRDDRLSAHRVPHAHEAGVDTVQQRWFGRLLTALRLADR